MSDFCASVRLRVKKYIYIFFIHTILVHVHGSNKWRVGRGGLKQSTKHVSLNFYKTREILHADTMRYSCSALCLCVCIYAIHVRSPSLLSLMRAFQTFAQPYMNIIFSEEFRCADLNLIIYTHELMVL